MSREINGKLDDELILDWCRRGKSNFDECESCRYRFRCWTEIYILDKYDFSLRELLRPVPKRWA